MTYNYSDISLSEFPGEISLILYSPFCNYYCPWCFNPDLRDKKPLSFKQAKSAIDEHRNFITALVLSGGEPLFNPNLGKILQYAHSNGLKTKINTNGTMPMYNKGIMTIQHVDYLNISLKHPDLCTCIEPSQKMSFIYSRILEYSLVYSSTIFPKLLLNKWAEQLNAMVIFHPDIFTISQMQTGECLNSDYNSCKVPTREELIEVAALFKHIPKKKLIIETKEFGRENVIKEV